MQEKKYSFLCLIPFLCCVTDLSQHIVFPCLYLTKAWPQHISRNFPKILHFLRQARILQSVCCTLLPHFPKSVLSLYPSRTEETELGFSLWNSHSFPAQALPWWAPNLIKTKKVWLTHFYNSLIQHSRHLPVKNHLCFLSSPFATVTTSGTNCSYSPGEGPS